MAKVRSLPNDQPALSYAARTKVLRELLPIAEEFIAELPTREAALRLRQLRHQNPAAQWESNDMIDIAYLACAVVHCDCRCHREAVGP